jgi:hypothetical protein
MMVEETLGWYPIIPETTLKIKRDLSEVEAGFAMACKEDQSIGRELWVLTDCGQDTSETFECHQVKRNLETRVEEVNSMLEGAVARRKALSRELDLNWFQSTMMGTARYTHSHWLCAGPYSTIDYAMVGGFTRTDTP